MAASGLTDGGRICACEVDVVIPSCVGATVYGAEDVALAPGEEIDVAGAEDLGDDGAAPEFWGDRGSDECGEVVEDCDEDCQDVFEDAAFYERRG